MSEPGYIREIVRTARVEYPIPYICVVLTALSVAALGLATYQPLPLAWVTEALAALAALGAIGLPIYAATRKPELLRSENYSVMTRAFDVLMDKTANPDARAVAGKVIEGTTSAIATAPKVPHDPAPDLTPHHSEADDE